MNALLDPEYLRLYRQYVKSMQAFDIWLKKRSESRARWLESKGAPAEPRRPVGPPPAVRSSQGSIPGTPPPPRKPTKGIYLGDILGWAKIVNGTPSVDAGPDPAAEYDASAFFDEVQLHLYWNAKLHYEKCRKEFFDYVRRGLAGRGKRPLSNIYQENLRRAKGYVQTAADMQLMGVDEASSDAHMRNAMLEVESACYKIWENYQNNPEKKKAKLMLLEGLVDAQLVGIDDSPIVQKMSEELQQKIESWKGEK